MTTIRRIADLLERGISEGADAADALVRRSLAARPGTCSCEIPPPCWLPRELDDVVSVVCPGGTALLRLRVTNRSIETTSVTVDAVGDDAGSVTATPERLELEPFQRGVITLTLPVAAEAAAGERELLVRVHGCLEHVLRWSVRAASRGRSSCHEIEVEDAPDYVHHWYDHFYCARPCGHGRAIVGTRG